MSSPELPNPDTYLNHLLLSDAREFTICRNVTLAVLGATVWDILVYILDDIQIVRRSCFGLVIFCFLFSGFFTMVYVLVSVIDRTMPIENPHALDMATGFLCVLSMTTASYLFLRRVHAVYAENKYVQRFFSAFWVMSPLAELTIPLGIHPTFTPGTHYEKDAGLHPYAAIGAFIPLLFGSFVFLAISYKIASTHSLADERVSWNTVISGKALPWLSRAVLHGGQQYYLITVGMTTLVGILLDLPSVYQIFKLTFTEPAVPLMASMACRVFRNIKLLDFNTVQ